MVKARACYTIRILICLVATTHAFGDWEEAAPLSTGPRSGHGIAAVGRKIYVFGGLDDTGVLSSVLEYDPASDSWERKADMPFARGAMGSAVLGGKIYVVGGLSAGVIDAVHAYDPATDSWRQRASLPIPSFWLGCAAVRGKLYAIGGGAGEVFLTSVFEYDPAADTWTQKRDAPKPLVGIAAAEVDGRIYVFGGLLGGPNVAQSTALAYDPALDEWTPLKDMPTTRQLLSASAVDDGVYAIGGEARPGGLPAVRAEVEKYDVTTGRWRRVDSLPAPRTRHAAAVADGRVYVIGGYVGGLIHRERSESVLVWDTGLRDVTDAGKLVTTWGALRARSSAARAVVNAIAGK